MSYWRGTLLPVDGRISRSIRELERMVWNSLLLVGTLVLSSRIAKLGRHCWEVRPP